MHVIHKSITLLLQDKHTSDIIVLVSSTMFQNYDIILCDHGHIPLHYLKKIKSRKIDNKKKEKSK